MLDEQKRLQYRQGLLAISLAMAGGTPIPVLEKKIMQIPDATLIEITEQFGALAKKILAELKLGEP